MLCLLCFGLWVHLRCTALNQGSVYCGVEPSPFWSPESKALNTVVWVVGPSPFCSPESKL